MSTLIMDGDILHNALLIRLEGCVLETKLKLYTSMHVDASATIILGYICLEKIRSAPLIIQL